MACAVGKITVLSNRSVKWKISEISWMCFNPGKFRSDFFPLAIGNCCFLLQNVNFTYKLKLEIPRKSTFQSIILSVEEGHKVLQYQLFLKNEEPMLKFQHSQLKPFDDTPISIYCALEMDAVGAEMTLNKNSVFHDEKVVTPKNKGTTKLIKDLEEILRSGKDSDAVLKIQGKEFKVHRLIVGMRSPVFSAMFENEMEEKKSGVVNIEDCDPETFPDFLHYMYTGAVENLTSKNALQLFAAADKYQLQELKEECLEYMKSNVSVENFCDIMTFTLQHQEEELTRIATEFFLKNAADVVPTAKWTTFLTKNVIAGNELIVKLIAKK